MRLGKRIESQLPMVEVIAAKITKLSAMKSTFEDDKSRKMIALRISNAIENSSATKVTARFLPKSIFRLSMGERINVRIPLSSKANKLHERPASIRKT